MAFRSWGVLLLAATYLVMTAYAGKVPHRIREITSGPYAKYSNAELVQLGDNYYYFENNAQGNWYVAMEFCRNIGLHMASVETEEEHNLIVEYIRGLGYNDYWLSGSDAGEENSYVWMSTGKKFTFTAWEEGEPNNSWGDEHFVQYKYENGVLLWNDEEGETEMHFICEELCEPCQQH